MNLKKLGIELAMNNTELAELLGVTRQTIHNWIRDGVPTDKNPFINQKVLEYKRYGVINHKPRVVNDPEDIYFVNKSGNIFNKVGDQILMTVPMVPFKAHAQYLHEIESDAKTFEDFDRITFPVDHLGRGNYMGFQVSGDSMNGGGIDDIPDKALILGREIGRHLWQDGFKKTPHGFVIITNTNIMVKDISGIEGDKIRCHSRNPSPEYSTDFTVPFEFIHKIFNVVKRVM